MNCLSAWSNAILRLIMMHVNMCNPNLANTSHYHFPPKDFTVHMAFRKLYTLFAPLEILH